MKSDVLIAQETRLRPIGEIAAGLGLAYEEFEPYGRTKAKIDLSALENRRETADGKLILVTAINPTPAGEGKTTTNVGLSMALNKLGYSAITTLREPSLGPCFGMKGGAAGGGYAQVLPMEDINLHFTGDFHAITSAHNLLAALIDNHLQQGNNLGIDTKRVVWKRVMDMNDRALRHIIIGMGSRGDGVMRESGFDITVASEIMAILCLTSGVDDLKERLGRMIVAYRRDGSPVTAGDLQATGAMALLLKDALKPNLVQTVENTPAIIHGGPFANIAHGCNSVLATRTALKLADYVITEAGFGADLGAEKFFDIKSRFAGLKPALAVLVATVRALKMNGGVAKADLGTENLTALELGLANLEQHIENLQKFGVPVVVAINHFPGDSKQEVELIRHKAEALGVREAVSTVFADGGDGGLDLARLVVESSAVPSDFKMLYDTDLPADEKINKIAREIYRADGVEFTPEALKQLASLQENGFDHLPICMAKTQYSFSDNPKLLGAPRGFKITVRELRVAAGAGFIVALTGDIMTMPGLPKLPAALGMDLLPDGTIIGLS